MLAFDPQDLVAMRVRPAQFARMCEVSKQAVSDWIRRGVVTLGPDGFLDPIAASRQVFERTDPARLRARVFKNLARDVPELKERVRDLNNELRATRGQLQELSRSHWPAAQVSSRLFGLLDAIADEEEAVSIAIEEGGLYDFLHRLAETCFFQGAAPDREFPEIDPKASN